MRRTFFPSSPLLLLLPLLFSELAPSLVPLKVQLLVENPFAFYLPLYRCFYCDRLDRVSFYNTLFSFLFSLPAVSLILPSPKNKYSCRTQLSVTSSAYIYFFPVCQLPCCYLIFFSRLLPSFIPFGFFFTFLFLFP